MTSASPGRPRPSARDRFVRRLRDSAAGQRMADLSRTRRETAKIRASGCFDEAFYRAQAGPELGPKDDPIRHYVIEGSATGLAPHPLFDPEHYLQHSAKAAASVANPFVEFLTRGTHRGDSPSPLFVTSAHLEARPEAADHPYGPWGHFLSDGTAPWPNPDVDAIGARGRGGHDYAAVAGQAVLAHRRVPDFRDFERVMDEFDHAFAAQFVERMRPIVEALDTPPRVSVVIPTKDRAATVMAAIASVQAQSYPHWELIVVDDGGSDETDRLVADLARTDDRIQYVHQQNTGVAGARNHGIRRSSGPLLAFLDSDNTWVPEFLETMVGFLADQRLRAAYCASELRSEDRVQYRGRPLNVEALRERNYIDCITIVMERSLIDDLGEVFDENLRRVVDWDLLVRLSETTELGYAPFVGTSYDLWDETGDRISHEESVGYRHVVRNKHLVDWSAAPTPVRGRTSVILALSGRGDEALADVRPWARALRPVEGLEFLVVDNGLPRLEALRLRLVAELTPNLTLLRLADSSSQSVARNLGASRATGDVLVFAEAPLVADAQTMALLGVVARETDGAVVQPVVLERDGTVRSIGHDLGPRAICVAVGHGLAGDDSALASHPTVDGPDGVCFAVSAHTYRRLGGLDPLFVHGGGDLDLGLRAAPEDVQTVRAPDLSVGLARGVRRMPWSPDPADRKEFVRRWRETPTATAGEPPASPSLTPARGERLAATGRWMHVVQRPVGPRRRWAIKTAVPDVASREAWGDWHFACALRDALRRLGEDAVVDMRTGWGRPASELDDVRLVLRGTQPYEPAPDAISLLWVISHPDRLTAYELDRYDHVFVASTTFADEVNARWPGTDARPLLQCTDPSRFFPGDDVVPTELLFIGNSRRQLRPVVDDAIATGHAPTVYGADWEGLIPSEFVKGTHVPNADLRRHYAGAGVLLNDHWEDMRRHGFISNRLFDAVASGAVVVTDQIDGIEPLFGSHVVPYAQREELPGAIVEARSRHRGDDDDVARIRQEHTFLARAQTLVDTVEATSVARPPRVTRSQRPRVEVVAPTPTQDHDQRASAPPVFVGGTGRSGTTIMAQLLGSSSRYALIPIEMRFHADPQGLPDVVTGKVDVEEFLSHLAEQWYFRRPNKNGHRGIHVVMSWSELERAMAGLREAPRADRTRALGQFVHDVFDPLAVREGADSWIEMTPTNARAAGDLHVALPHARFVHMVRDGRDVATSVAQRRWGPDDLLTAIPWWADEMIAIHRSMSRVPADQVLELRMESLVDEDRREDAWERLCDFLDLGGDPLMRDFFDTSITAGKARWGRWQQGLTADEIETVEALYDTALARLEEAGAAMPTV